MNAHNLLMPFLRKIPPPRPKATTHSFEFDCSSTATIVETYIVCRVSDVFTRTVCYCFKRLHPFMLSLSASCCLTPELISQDAPLWAIPFRQGAYSTNISPHCTVQYCTAPASSLLQMWLKWLSWFPWKPGAQRSGKIHFTLQLQAKTQRDG